MATPLPLSFDLHILSGETIAQEIRFKCSSGNPPNITAEPLISAASPVSFTASEWITDDIRVLAFVERACDIKRDLWSRDVEPDMEIKFNQAGTQLVFEALTLPSEVFIRTVDYTEPGGVPTVTVQPYNASDPMTLHTLQLFFEAVESLIEMNNGGSTTRGL
jgi:hypothetical protein